MTQKYDASKHMAELEYQIDTATDKEIKRLLSRTAYKNRKQKKKEIEAKDLQSIKKEELRKRFNDAEPQLIEYMDKYRDDLKAFVDQEIEKIIDFEFDRIERMEKFVPNRYALKQVLNDEFVDRVVTKFRGKVKQEQQRLQSSFSKRRTDAKVRDIVRDVGDMTDIR